MVKKILMFLLSTMLVSTAMADNARMEALGDNEMFHDPLTILEIPSFMVNYPDLIQGTANSGGFGAVLVTKSIGSMITLGSYTTSLDKDNPSSVLNSNFYQSARLHFLTSGMIDQDGLEEIPENFVPIPHILFAMKLGNAMNIGVDLFYEKRSISSTRYT